MNDKALIVYKSRTGFTKKYAEMAAKETGCAITDYKTVTAEKLSNYTTIVFGSRAWAGRIDGYSQFQKLFEKSGSKQFAVFVTGATPASETETIANFWSGNLSAQELQSIPHFYMPGGLCYEKMSLLDKIMMKTMTAMLKRKKEKSEQDEALIQTLSSSYDISSEEFVKPLTAFLKHCNSFGHPKKSVL